MVRQSHTVLTLLIASLIVATPLATSLSSASEWVSPHFADNEVVGMVFDREGNPGNSLEEVKKRAVQARYVLIGEIHPNPDHHRLQAEILQHMIDAGRKPAIVFEMVTRSQQAVLDNLANNPPADRQAIAQALEWHETGWPDFAMYQPLFEIALKHGLKMWAGNLEKSTVRRLGGRVGSRLSEAERAMLGLDKPLAEQATKSLKQNIAEGHCNMMPESILPLMADIQRARDFTMATAMQNPANTDGAVLIAGSGHTRLDWGVPAYIVQDASNELVSIGLAETFEGATANDFSQTRHDFTIVTPRIDVTDHCENFKSNKK